MSYKRPKHRLEDAVASSVMMAGLGYFLWRIIRYPFWDFFIHSYYFLYYVFYYATFIPIKYLIFIPSVWLVGLLFPKTIKDIEQEIKKLKIEAQHRENCDHQKILSL